MARLTAFFIPVFLISCGDAEPEARIDPRLVPHVSRWIRECKEVIGDAGESRCHVRDLDAVRVAEKIGDDETIGQCHIGYRGVVPYKEVIIKESAINNSYSMRALMHHEMIHCVFEFYTHTDEGIMRPYMLPEKTLRNNWAELLRKAYALVE